MEIHELNTKGITSPAYVALDDGVDTYKLDLYSKFSAINTEFTLLELADENTAHIWYGYTTTASGTATKAVSLQFGGTFTPKTGDYIVVAFSQTNTASTMSLSVASGDAVSVIFTGSTGADIPKGYHIFHITVANGAPYQYHYVGIHATATNTIRGLMSASDKSALDTAVSNIGTLANLTTTEKGSLVGAINELDADNTNLKNETNQIYNQTHETEDITSLLTTETNRAIRSNLTIGAGASYSIAYFPITHLLDKEFLVQSDTPLDYLCMGFSDVFPSYDVQTYNGTSLVNQNATRILGSPRTTSLFVVISYKTAVESHVTLSVVSDDIYEHGKDITELNRQVAGIATEHTNLLENATIYEDYLYPHYSDTKEANTATNCFSPIPVKANVPVYFRRAWGNFTCCKYNNGTYVSLIDGETDVINGTFTPSNDGVILFTVESIRDATSALLTTSEELYNSGFYASEYVPNKLRIGNIYHVEKDGSGNFTKLSDAIIEATKHMDSVVYVGAGTWDLISELGSTYIESVNINNRGLYLKNRIHLIFASNSKVTCNYTGSTADVMTWLSAFNAGEYGFTLENCRIEASKCRYAVHDERDQDSDAYTNHYINCSMYMDNSNNTATTAHQCIGGGLGKNGHIIIENCDFESVNTRAVPSVYTPVSYHNSAGTGKSRIDASGVYMVEGTFRLNWYGTSTEKTECYVHDCSMTHAILNGAETSGSTNENMEVIAWNNEIRTA